MAGSTGIAGMPMRAEATAVTLPRPHPVPRTRCRSLRLIPCMNLARHTPKMTAAITPSGMKIVVHHHRRFGVLTAGEPSRGHRALDGRRL